MGSHLFSHNLVSCQTKYPQRKAKQQRPERFLVYFCTLGTAEAIKQDLKKYKSSSLVLLRSQKQAISPKLQW